MESVQFYNPTAVSSSTSKPAGKPSTKVCEVADKDQSATPLQTLGLGVLNAPASKPSETPCKPVHEPIDKTATVTAQPNKLESDNSIQTRSSEPIFKFPPGYSAEQPANVPAAKKGFSKFRDEGHILKNRSPIVIDSDDDRKASPSNEINHPRMDDSKQNQQGHQSVKQMLDPAHLESLPSQPVEQGDLKTLSGEQVFSQQTGIPKHRGSASGNMDPTGPKRTKRSRDQTSKPDNESPAKAVASKRTSSKRKASVEVHRPKRSRMTRRAVLSEDSDDETEAFSSDNSVYHDLIPNQLKDSIEGPRIRRDDVIADKVAKVKGPVRFDVAEDRDEEEVPVDFRQTRLRPNTAAISDKSVWGIDSITDESSTQFRVQWKSSWVDKRDVRANALVRKFRAARQQR